MILGNPTFLWALSGLLVPIAIHLWSKKEAKTIKIGSIELLTTSNSKQSKSIKLNELWLLILRMLVISILVLIISEPKWKNNSGNTAITFIVEPTLLNNNSVLVLLDSLNEEVDIRLLKKSLPLWKLDSDILESNEIANYWQLIQEINRLKTDSIVVFSNAYAKGFEGKRPAKSRDINWIVLDSGKAEKKVLQAVQKDENVKLTSIVTSAEGTSITNELISKSDNRLRINLQKDSIQLVSSGNVQKIPLGVDKPIKVLLYSSDDFKTEKAYIYSSFKALASYLKRPIDVELNTPIDTASIDIFDLVIWLSKAKAPELKKPLLLFKEDEYASHLIQPTEYTAVFQLTSYLNIENSTSGHLTEELLNLLDLDVDLKNQISGLDQRKMDIEELKSDKLLEDKNETEFASLDISIWFWLVLLFLMVLERLLANYKKQ